MPNFIDLTGLTFGRLTVLAYDTTDPPRRYRWHCLCNCGTKTIVRSSFLRGGQTRSCGCLHKESARRTCIKRNTIHGKSQTPEYHSWYAMKDRCLNSDNPKFHHYGGRGIKICKRWQSFGNFLADMGPRPSPQHSLDRRNTNGDYKPNNCRWVTRDIQVNNTRSSRYLQVGDEILTIAQWSKRLDIPWYRLGWRLKAGWPPEKIISPLKHDRSGKPLSKPQ
jgi:hypothetical protein